MFYAIDKTIITWLKKYSERFGRIGFFIIFFWFGILKVLNLSPADELVQSFFQETFLTSLLTYQTFFMLLGTIEMVIGMLFLFKRLTRVALFILLVHMTTTFLPLIFLPDVTWKAPFVPTIEGQYILKNIVIVALGFFTAIHLTPQKHLFKK